jgi:hypothetical protein
MENYELPDGLNKRLRYFNGQFLVAQDLIDEQNYHLDRHRRQNRLLRTPGILEGLEVSATSENDGIQISPGTAVDYKGRLIILNETLSLNVEGYSDKTVALAIAYSQHYLPEHRRFDRQRWPDLLLPRHKPCVR